MDRLERVLGGLFGVACGDALGATLEFTDKEIGMKKYCYHKDIIGGGKMNLEAGAVTDDTVMTVAVAEGILADPVYPIDEIGDRFVKWYLSGPPDIGITCQDAISEYIDCKDWKEAGRRVYKLSDGWNAGNGTLMRCIPVPLFYKDYNKMVEITKAQSDMTHYNEEASNACIIYNTIVYNYLKDGEKIETIENAVKGYGEYEEVFWMKKEDLNPSGYVVDSLQCALWCFINYSKVEEIICEAVNLYGDPDTIGAIAGGLAGAYYGYNAIPERWREKILIKDELIGLAQRLNKKAMSGQ